MGDDSVHDADLARGARAGDVEALAGLFERYRPSLYASAIGYLRNREDALDAVQETCVVALVGLRSLRDPAAVGGWLHAIVRNACLMRLRRTSRETPAEPAEVIAFEATPEEVLEQNSMRDWIWDAIETLDNDERITVMMRYFSRCRTYQEIAAATGVPLGTVRSRLHRARTLLNGALQQSASRSALSHVDLVRARRADWEQFYAALHDAPVPRTYRDAYTPDVHVTDGVGRWTGVNDWSAHEREAISLGVRANIVGLIASRDVTVVEIDFANPWAFPDHCPPRSTFVHHLASGRSHRLDIHYV
jgi:RNA polymerase sigma-70 factor (ECF subfamily)